MPCTARRPTAPPRHASPLTCGPEVAAGVDLDLGRLAAVLGEVEVDGGPQRGAAEQQQEAAQRRHGRPAGTRTRRCRRRPALYSAGGGRGVLRPRPLAGSRWGSRPAARVPQSAPLPAEGRRGLAPLAARVRGGGGVSSPPLSRTPLIPPPGGAARSASEVNGVGALPSPTNPTVPLQELVRVGFTPAQPGLPNPTTSRFSVCPGTRSVMLQAALRGHGAVPVASSRHPWTQPLWAPQFLRAKLSEQ